MTWDAVHHRGDVLRAVAETADRRRDGILPTDVPGVVETFGDDPLTLVSALQLRWHTRLAGGIERALMDTDDLTGAVLTGWRATAAAMPGVRMVLDAYVADPTSAEMAEALAKASAKDAVLLAAMAGRASVSSAAAVRVGRELEQQARTAYDPTVPPRHRREPDEPRSGLLGRLRAVLAA